MPTPTPWNSKHGLLQSLHVLFEQGFLITADLRNAQGKTLLQNTPPNPIGCVKIYTI